MKVFSIDIDPANSDADGLADGNDSSGATVTLDGVLTSGGSFTSADGLARRLIITDAGADDQSGATYTITGTDADGNAQTESLAGPSTSGSVETTKYFLTVSSVAIASPAATSTVDIGTVDELSTKTYPINAEADPGACIQVVVTGTINYSVEGTVERIGASPQQNNDFTDITAFSGKTASLIDNAPAGVAGLRFVANSFTDGAELQVHVKCVR